MYLCTGAVTGHYCCCNSVFVLSVITACFEDLTDLWTLGGTAARTAFKEAGVPTQSHIWTLCSLFTFRLVTSALKPVANFQQLHYKCFSLKHFYWMSISCRPWALQVITVMLIFRPKAMCIVTCRPIFEKKMLINKLSKREVLHMSPAVHSSGTASFEWPQFSHKHSHNGKWKQTSWVIQSVRNPSYVQ